MKTSQMRSVLILISQYTLQVTPKVSSVCGSLIRQQIAVLTQWVLEPEVPPKDANPKKSSIKKIEFTPYGDKFLTLNAEGSVFLHAFDLSDDHSALFVLKGNKISDFGFIDNDGTVIAVLSSSNKALSIIDCITG